MQNGKTENICPTYQRKREIFYLYNFFQTNKKKTQQYSRKNDQFLQVCKKGNPNSSYACKKKLSITQNKSNVN